MRRRDEWTKVVDLDGRALDARFAIESIDGRPTLVFDSAGDTRNPRNTDYNSGLEVLLMRLRDLGAEIEDAVVDSAHPRMRALPHASRRLAVLGSSYPIRPGDDLRALRIAIARAQAAIRTDPQAKGGNGQKRVRFYLNGYTGDNLARDLTMPPRAQFRDELTTTLRGLPFPTPRGQVLRQRRTETFGFPGGTHGAVECWVYRAHGSPVDVLFGFYQNFTADDLVTKVVARDEEIPNDAGASIQFNGDRSVARVGGSLELRHHGHVTVVTRRSRRELVDAIRTVAADADDELGGLHPEHGWPLLLGTTVNLAALIDRLALYSYAVEQAKRHMRREDALPLFYANGSLRQRAEVIERRRGQGFNGSAAQRAAVEAYAMKLATEHYQSEKWSVEDVSANRAYDLHCTRGKAELRVEVKGTTGAGDAVLLTANEVEHARTHHPNVALFVVSGVILSGPAESSQGSGGTIRVISPWEVDAGKLVPLSFAYELPVMA